MRGKTFFKRMENIGRPKVEAQLKHSFYLSSDIVRFSKYIKQISLENPSLSREEDIEQAVISDFYYNLSPIVMRGNYSFENYMDLLSCRYLLENPETFEKIYDEVSKPDYKSKPYSECKTFEEFLYNYTYSSMYLHEADYIAIAREYLSEDALAIIDAPDMSKEEKYEKVCENIKVNSFSRIQMTRGFRDAKVALYGAKYALKENEKITEDELRADLEKSICLIISTMKKMGSYDQIKKVNDRNFSQAGFPEFHKGKNGGECIYADITENPSILRTIDIDTLLLLNSFWLNRYTKEIESYANALSVIHENKLLGNVLNGDVDKIDFSKEYLSPTIQKKHVLYPIIKIYIDKIKKSVSENNIEPGTLKKEGAKKLMDADSYFLISYTPLKKIVHNEHFDDEYRDHFRKLTPLSKNNPEDDIVFYATLNYPTIMAYSEKSNYICALATTLASNSVYINAGIIPDRPLRDKDTQIQLSDFIGIGIDARLTFPVREHVKTSALKEFVKSFTGSTIIPIYSGSDDFAMPYGDGKFMSAQLVLPFSDKQIELLKEYMHTDFPDQPKKAQLVKHLSFLASQNYNKPQELINEDGKSGNYDIHKSKRKYVDLETKRIYVKDNNNEFVLYNFDERKDSHDIR